MEAIFNISRSSRSALTKLWDDIRTNAMYLAMPLDTKYLVKECFLMQINELLNNVISIGSGEAPRGGVRSMYDMSDILNFLDNEELYVPADELGTVNGERLDEGEINVDTFPFIISILSDAQDFSELETCLVRDVRRLGIDECGGMATFRVGMGSITLYDFDHTELRIGKVS